MQIDSNISDIPISLKECVTDLADFVGNDPKQREKLESWRQELRKHFDSEAYKQPGREWYQTAFVENFLFMYDKSFYDRSEKRYRIDELLDEGELNFGGYDFILLWQAYSRIGIDNRNQFDYYRDMLIALSPFVGTWAKQTSLMQFFICLELAYDSTLAAVDMFRYSVGAIDNRYLREQMSRSIGFVKQGRSFAACQQSLEAF